VVACDGARSALRQLQGLALEGDSYHGRFVIADIRVDLPLPTERLAFFDPPWNPGNTVLMHREPLGIWRIDYQLPAGETPEQALDPASLKARIDAQLASVGFAGAPWEMDWCSVYSARALTLPDYVNGPVVYCGDAAHLLPIFGVRGANTGFQDAQNLAWKLAAVVQGRAPMALLHSYSTERVSAAREIVAEAGKSTRFMAPPTRGFRLLRDATLSLALTQDFVRPLMHWRTSRPHEYLRSPLNSPEDDTRCSAPARRPVR
jgi:3-(3-hydroxy-phenyl)propionate hydroxylase